MVEGLKNKRAQVTIFIIIAMLLVGGIAGYFLIKEKNNTQSEAIPAEVKPIYDLVRNCIHKTAINGLNANSLTGGYYDLFGPISSGAVYYVVANKSQIPSRDTIRREFEKYTEDKLTDCLDNFSSFKTLTINEGKIKVDALINDASIIIEVNYPLSINKEDLHWNLEKFKDIVISTNYGLLNDIAINISKMYLQNNQFSLTSLSEVSRIHNLTVNLQHGPEYTLIKIINNPQNKSPGEFDFALS